MHSGFINEAEESRAAILFIHGIFGSPNQFHDISKRLTKAGFTTQGILLPGHGGSAKDFAQNGAKQWQRAVFKAALNLRKKHDKLILVGHSMGGLLSLRFAQKHKVEGIILLSTPTALKPSLKQIKMCLSILFGNIKKDTEFLKSYRKAFSVGIANFFDYITWLRPLWDLQRMITSTTKILPDIICPVFISQGDCDETVSKHSPTQLQRGLINSHTELLRLKKSTHSHYELDERELLLYHTMKFIYKNTK